MVAVEIKIHETRYKKLLKLKKYGGIFCSLINKFVYLIFDLANIWVVADLERWHCILYTICWVKVSTCISGLPKKKILVDYGAFMKLVKLQSWPKYVQSWNVINTCFRNAILKFWCTETTQKSLFNLVEGGKKKKKNLNKGNEGIRSELFTYFTFFVSK